MSSAIAPATLSDAGWMSRLISDAASVRQQLETLTNQASTGLVGSTYAGLGSGAPIALNLNPQLANITTWQANINQATGSMQVTQATMTQIQSIAQSLYAQLGNLNGMSASAVDSIAAQARGALSDVANLLDATNGNTYVFGGADTANPPVPNPDQILSSGFYTQIAAAVGNLSSNGAATMSSTLAIAASNAAGTSPFSTYMSQPAATLQADIPVAQVSQNQTVAIGLLASANTSVPSTGSETTGSYMRDTLAAIATIGALSSSQVSDPGFQGLVQNISTSLQGAMSAMAEDAGVLGNTQASLTATQTRLADTATALTTQVSAVQNVDMAQTLSNLSLVQTQMQASYQIIAGMSGLSLAKYLPA